MQTLFTQALVISSIFVICKFIELRFVRRDVNDGLKPIPRETLIVFVSACTHILIFIMFFAFDGCILTRIERRFSENCDDFTVIDPILNLIHVNRTNENRMIYSVYLSLIGFLATYLIYYYRFILTD